MKLSFLPQPWRGMRIHVPCPPRRISAPALSRAVRDRGGLLVDAGEGADIVVLPERDPTAVERRGLVARLAGQGALVMWEGAFLRALNGRS